MIIRAPGLRPSTRRDPAEQIDLVPTLLALLGLEVPTEGPGRDLFEDQGKMAEMGERPAVFIERQRPSQFHQRAVLLGRYKLIVVDPSEDASAGLESASTQVRAGTYLFDLQDDPGERRNLFDPADPTSRQLLALLEAHSREPGTPGEQLELEEELREDLRSLGYLQ